MRMSKLQEVSAASGTKLNQDKNSALRRMYALRAILLAKAGQMEQANDCYKL